MDLEITPAWLQTVLAADFPGIDIRSVEAEPIGEGYGLASERRRCRFPSGPGSVIVKRWSTDGLGGAGEVHFYRDFAPIPGVRIPRCHHGSIDVEAREGVLVLEDLGDVIQGDCLVPVEAPRAERVSRALAAVHAAFWGDPTLGTREWLPGGWPAGRDGAWVEERRTKFLMRHGHLVDPVARGILDRMDALLIDAEARLVGAPETLLHGDFHLDNVLFERESHDPILLDWARVARGPAVSDAVVLVTTVAEPGARDRAFAAYRDGLRDGGVVLDEAAFRRQFGGALVRQFCRSSCGVANWDVAPGRETRLLETGYRQALAALHWWASREEPGFPLPD